MHPVPEEDGGARNEHIRHFYMIVERVGVRVDRRLQRIIVAVGACPYVLTG